MQQWLLYRLRAGESQANGIWYVMQSEGRLHFNMRGGIDTVCEGGIDDDGRFWRGIARDQALLLIRGLALGRDDLPGQLAPNCS